MNLLKSVQWAALYHDITISRHLDIGGRKRARGRERDQCPFFVAAVDGGGGGVLAGTETSGSKKRRGLRRGYSGLESLSWASKWIEDARNAKQRVQRKRVR